MWENITTATATASAADAADVAADFAATSAADAYFTAASTAAKRLGATISKLGIKLTVVCFYPLLLGATAVRARRRGVGHRDVVITATAAVRQLVQLLHGGRVIVKTVRLVAGLLGRWV